MSNSRPWGRCLSLAVSLLVVLPPRAARAETEVERHIAEAVRLYEELEYELALEQLERASKVSHGTEEEVTRFLYMGLISADLGRWAAARAAFRSALMLNPDARLPLRTAPKVAAAFESQQEKVQAERARTRTGLLPLAKSRPPAPDRVIPPELDKVSPLPAEPREQVARPDLVPARPDEASRQLVAERAWTRSVPIVSVVLLGVGVAAGGVGTYCGLSSRRQLDEVRGRLFRTEMMGPHAQAQRSATTANILFGTAGMAAAGAVVTWLLIGDKGTATVQRGVR